MRSKQHDLILGQDPEAQVALSCLCDMSRLGCRAISRMTTHEVSPRTAVFTLVVQPIY